MPSDRNRRPIEARTFGSSSMTRTVESASGIAAARIGGYELLPRFAGLGPAVLIWLDPRTALQRPNLAHGTINLSMGLLNHGVTWTSLRRMEQAPRPHYY